MKFNAPAAGWHQWFLITSDVHWDSPHCRRGLYREHLEEAVARDALIIDLGDMFDLMQGRHDRRRSASGVRAEHQVEEYYDTVIDDCIECHMPFAGRYLITMEGNHEKAARKNAGVHPQRRFADAMGARALGTGGMLNLKVARGTHHLSTNWFLQHGHGGGGIVTKGVIQAQRRQAALANVSLVVSGHIHEAWMVEHTQHGVRQTGNEFVHHTQHVSVPGYKDEYPVGMERLEGWAVERGQYARPIGAWFVKLYVRARRNDYHLFERLERTEY